jgi:hypothetical protein
VLAYVFWHWKKAAISAADYEERQRAFHAALTAAPSLGFDRSLSVGISLAPWAAGGGDAYEDWYLVHDFGALGVLNASAVSGTRTDPHRRAAAAAAGGTAGVYGLRIGTTLPTPQHACWLSKPTGMRYADLFAELAPMIGEMHGALWMRQMTLGPAREFCLHTASPAHVPPIFSPLLVPMRPVWPE